MRLRARAAAALWICLSVPLCAQEEKPMISVLDFKATGISEAEVEVFVDFVSSHILETRRFRVIDRMQREAILEEIEFSQSDCTDENCRLQIGRLLSATQIIVGSIGKVGDYFILNMKSIEVETGETIRSASEKYTSINAMIDDSKRLAYEFVGVSAGAESVAAAPSATAPSQPAVQAGAEQTAAARDAIDEQRRTEELQQELEELQRKADPEEYREWLRAKGFEEREREGSLEDRIEFTTAYLREITTSGWSVQIGPVLDWGRLIGYFSTSPGTIGIDGSVYAYDQYLGETRHTAGGLNVGCLRQFGNLFSLGFSIYGSAGRTVSTMTYSLADHPTMDTYTETYGERFMGSVIGSVDAVIGNKVKGIAGLVGLGFGFCYDRWSIFPFALRVGAFYRNIYLSYSITVDPINRSGARSHYLTAGYSFFFLDRE